MLTVLRHSSFVMASPDKPFFRFYTHGGILYPVYGVLFFICITDCVLKLAKGLSAPKTGLTKPQIQYILAATLIGFLGGWTAFLPVFNLPIYPVGMFVVFLYPVIMAYAIVRHRLMDIEVIIKKTLVFAGLFSVIYGVFTGISFLGQEIFNNFFGFSRSLAIIPTVMIIIFIHEPIKKFLINVTDKFLFQKKYSPAGLLRAFAREVVAEYDINQITHVTVKKLSEILRVKSCAIFIPGKDRDKYILANSEGLQNKDVVYHKGSALVVGLSKSDGIIHYQEGVGMSTDLANDLKMVDAKLVFAISTHKEIIGLLTLGSKKSDEDYSSDDIEILKSLSDALGLAINTALVFEDVVKKEKLITVGTMVAGIRHDISSPINLMDMSLQLFLLDKEQGRHEKLAKEEFCSEAYSLMERCKLTFQKVIAISSKFADAAKPKDRIEFELVSAQKIVDTTLAVIEAEAKLKDVTIVKEFENDLPMMRCDQDYMQQILFNLIRNAMYAIKEAKRPKEDSKIIVAVTKHGFNKVRIAITDTGTGISEDKLQKIFEPYYTTKPEGVGTGLGLLIVKELTERMKGSVAVQSKLGESTTFILEFMSE